ncbi:JAB domain-containing protein [Azohydromonas lata]|uniref:JAB domain-containing protein n=1 Tax=Azohydromonas lata TaxID=45677 RepID=A0ABU5I7C0_9BURK|nr:JAB domain-containing protein [Azohydromonas lata]MDZ5454997.1 JAB domain-containing protein [Azohydromonas lata]
MSYMDLCRLSAEQLEALVLDPPGPGCELKGSDPGLLRLLPCGDAERSSRLRQVLCAAHELLVRVAHQSVVGRQLLDEPARVRTFLRVHFTGSDRLTLLVVFLDSRMRVIAAENMFAGSTCQLTVYAREVVKRALELGCVAVFTAHNRPGSDDTTPAAGEVQGIHTVRAALARVDIQVLEHYVVAGMEVVSISQPALP